MQFSALILNWFKKHGRHDLPWQHNTTPYRVWISEIMLQQTQVATVIPYYQQFMKSFPTLKSLSDAKIDNVLSHWSGLGYYARARNLHKAAKIIQEQYSGIFPDTVEKIAELPGIGLSTAGAILSLSMNKRAVILDGNVKRVLARYFAIASPINNKNTIDQLWQYAEKLTPDQQAGHYNQAMMDLGATLCTRTKPRCTDCPLHRKCVAYLEFKPDNFPIKIIKKSRPVKKTIMLIIHNNKQEILLHKRPPSGIWGGLWGLPEINLKMDLKNYFTKLRTLPEITHQFTHFTLEILPICVRLKNQRDLIKLDLGETVWYKQSSKLPGGVSTPVIKILQNLTKTILI